MGLIDIDIECFGILVNLNTVEVFHVSQIRDFSALCADGRDEVVLDSLRADKTTIIYEEAEDGRVRFVGFTPNVNTRFRSGRGGTRGDQRLRDRIGS